MSMNTLRLDPVLQKELDLESKALKVSRSEVLRQALKNYFQQRAQRQFRAALIQAASRRKAGADLALAEEFLPLENEALMVAERFVSLPAKKKAPRRRR